MITLKKIIPITLVLMLVLSIFNITLAASAASTNTKTITSDIVVLKNETTGKCANQYGGYTYNGNKTTLWSYSKNDTDIMLRFIYKNGGYKVYDHELKSVVLDVYRGSKSKAAKGMKIDTWADQTSENKFQIWLVERQSNGSYILRLKAFPNLALGITKNKNGAQLQLVLYNKSSAFQRWFFCNPNTGKKLTQSQIEKVSTSITASKDLANIPSANYKVTATYTIGSTKYQFCTVTKAWGTILKNSTFYRNSSTKAPVTNQKTLQKLKTITLVNSVSGTYISTLNSMKNAIESIYSVAAKYTRNEQMSKFLGVSGGAALKAVAACSTGQPIGLFDSAITLCKEAAEPETSLAVTTIAILKGCSNDTIYWCNRAKKLLSVKITDYDKAVQAVEAISMASGNYAAAQHLGRPIVEDIRATNAWSSTFKNIGCSLLEGCGFKAADALSKFENCVCMADALKQFGLTNKYNTAKKQVINTLILG